MDLFPFLIDAPEDGGIDSRAWLPADAAETSQQAIVEFEKRYKAVTGELPWIDDKLVLTCKSKVYLRTSMEVSDGEDVDTLYGQAAEEEARRDPYGTAIEELRYDSCEPDDDGAELFWLLVLEPIPVK